MKKFKLFMAVLLSAGVMVGTAALTACSDGGSGSGSGESKPIDEQTWISACEGIDYTNFSFSASNGYKVMISENVVYYNGLYDECYTVKNEDGTFVTYAKSGTDEDTRFSFVSRYKTFEQAVDSAKTFAVLDVSYEDYYNSFSYNDSTQTYVNNGVIEVSVTQKSESAGIDDIETYYFVDNIVKFSGDRIISYSTRINKYSCVCRCDASQPDHNDEGSDVDLSLEYYDFGTTVLEVPQSVIDEAMEDY